MKQQHFSTFFLFMCCLLPALSGSAQVSIPAAGVPVLVDFSGFAGTGFQPVPDPGQLDSDDWALTGMSDGVLNFGGTFTTGDFARGITAGAVSSGGLYALDRSGDIGLMIQPTGSDWNPGSITLRYQNNTGSAVVELSVAYDLLINNDQARASTMNFSYSQDNVDYTAVPALDYTSPLVADALGYTAIPRSSTLTGLNVPDGQFIYLRWNSVDAGGSGSRDELGLDNISLTASTGASAAAINFDNTALAVGEADGSVTVSASISDSVACSVEVALVGGTATNGADFSFNSPELLLFDGSASTLSFNIDIFDDGLLEGPETILLELQNVSGGCVIGASSALTITLLDDDAAPLGACANLYFSEYLEGSSNNKALEIYNPTSDSVDLSAYTVRVYNNGATSPSNTQVLSGLLAPGAVYVIANASADSAVLAVADITSTVTFFNGDDAVVLFNVADTIDIIGRVGEDPGVNWPIDTLGATSEFTLVRKPSVNAGQKDWNQGALEWLVFPQNTFDFLGAHDQDPCPVLCDTSVRPSDQSHTVLGGNVLLEWTPTPGAVICQAEAKSLPGGTPMPRKNTVTPPYNFVRIPKLPELAGTSWAWRVRCACSIDPLLATNFSEYGDTIVIPGAPRLMESLAAQVQVFPNPASSQVVLNWTSERSGTALLEVLDVQGRLVVQQRVALAEDLNTVELGVSTWSNGLYFARLDGVELARFSVQR